MSDETIYMGNTQNEDMNESERKSVIANVWKPITIGGFTGILLGAGALMASNASAANQGHEDTPQDDAVASTDEPVVDPVEQVAPETELDIANTEPGISFDEAFAAARAQVGPGGIFYWHGAIFSTYTVDEWNELTEAQQEQFAQQVRPEVDVDHVDAEQIAAVAAQDDADAAVEEDAPVADAAAEDDVLLADAAADEDVLVAEAAVDEDVLVADAAVEEDAPVEAAPVAEASVAEPSIAEFAEDLAMADVAPQEFVDNVELDEDVQIADSESQHVIEDLALADVSTKSSAAQDAEAQPHNIVHGFDSDDDVRIVGYGEFDGHVVTGLDLDGDNQADIAVIDVDDSGSYSRADIVIDNEGNMTTYGELEDFAQEQMPGEDQDHLNEDQAQNPEVAQDMPDYMDDALAQL